MDSNQTDNFKTFKEGKFRTVKEHLNSDFETLIREWFPNAHREGQQYKTGDFTDSKGKSLVIDLNKRIATDFSCGIIAKDIIEIYRYRFNRLSNYKALKELIDKYNLSYLFDNNSYSYNNNTNFNSIGYKKIIDLLTNSQKAIIIFIIVIILLMLI